MSSVKAVRSALLWLIAAVVLGVAEVLTLTLVLGFVAIGTLAGAGAAALGAGWLVQTVAALGTSALLLVAVRPVVRRHQHPGHQVLTGAEAMRGLTGIVTVPVGTGRGQINLRGERWAAVAAYEGPELAVGASVTVLRVDGATVVVAPV
jgi:membrane protein implicated in regulation of membrane protease activity